MSRLIFALSFLVLTFSVAGAPAHAASKAERAKALVDKAIEHYKDVGREQALKDFNDKSSEFVQGEFYVIAAEAETGIFKAHAINSALIDNEKIRDLQDVNGVYIIREMAKAGKKNPDGSWVEYVWTHPETDDLTPKRTWVERHDDLLFMVGFYEDQK